jgi:carboxymethylenebutenolidase
MRIALPSGTPAELARPDGDPARGVALAPDIMGLRPLFDDLCARLAAEYGWVVCAPEPFPGRTDLSIDDRVKSGVASLNDHEVLGDLVDAADATGCDDVAVIGFCMGGMYALKAGATGAFDKAVAFYGMIRLPDNWHGPGQGEPLDATRERTGTDVLAICGTEDPYTPPDDREALRATGVEVVEYPGAEHGFVHDPDRPAHRAADAADAWNRVAEFLG